MAPSSQSCTTSSMSNSRTFSPPKREHTQGAAIPRLLSLIQQHRSTSCLSGLAQSGNFTWVELYQMWSFMADLFPLAGCPQSLSMLWHVAVLFIVTYYSITWIYHVLLIHWWTFRLFPHVSCCAVNGHVQVFGWTYLVFLLHTCTWHSWVTW